MKKKIMSPQSLFFFCLLCAPGGLLWLRQLHRQHRGQRADELSIKPGDGDDPRWVYDVCGCWISHDDPALPAGHQHHAF